MATEELAQPLEERQIQALEKLVAMGKGPRESPDDKYDQDPTVRALQLVYEGKLGGPGRGQGRKRHPRAAELVAEQVRTKLAPKIVRALNNGLDSENDKTALTAAEMAIKIERDETALQLKEQSADVEMLTKEQLIETLFQLASDANTEAALAGVINLPESAYREVTQEAEEEAEGKAEFVSPSVEGRGYQDDDIGPDSTDIAPVGSDSEGSGTHGPGAAAGDREERPNPFTAAARRRSTKRRRAS